MGAHGTVVTSEVRGVINDQIMVGLLEIYSSIGEEPFTECFQQERRWSTNVFRKITQTADGLKKGGF